MNGRRWMWALLVATLAASGWLAMQDDAEVAVGLAHEDRSATAPPPRDAEPAGRGHDDWPDPPRGRASEAWAFDAASAPAWAPPPPPPPAPPPPPPPAALPVASEPAPPQAPPFPYTLIGRVEDGGQAQALLTGPAQTLGVKPQDVIDGQWRVDGVDERGLSITWLPGGQRKTIQFRSS